MKKELENYFYLEGISVAVENIAEENKRLNLELDETKRQIKRIKISVIVFNVFMLIVLGMVVFI